MPPLDKSNGLSQVAAPQESMLSNLLTVSVDGQCLITLAGRMALKMSLASRHGGELSVLTVEVRMLRHTPTPLKASEIESAG
jgi:hypothetical protein